MCREGRKTPKIVNRYLYLYGDNRLKIRWIFFTPQLLDFFDGHLQSYPRMLHKHLADASVGVVVYHKD